MYRCSSLLLAGRAKEKEIMKQIGMASLLMVLSVGAVAQVVASPVPESAASRLAASGTMDKEQMAARMASVEKLLTTSSAAKQIEASGDQGALAKRDQALGVFHTAKSAFDAGDIAKAAAVLPQATVLMFEAARLAAPADVLSKKQEADFNARHESVKALLDAYKRVAKEKSAVKGVSETVSSVEKSVAAGEKLAAAQKYTEGRAELDKAYLVAKAAISSLRSGDTLVRSLNFASKEEEYHYEIDRNETHLMLVKVLVEEKQVTNPALNEQVRSFLAKSKELRDAAEAAAGRKEYEKAIKLMEDSTLELVRAIRNAGIYIPG
ncbi:conserved exported protein of unknown function [Denitratisoma oestradiolicum]|uniref:YfdX protein n=2 Tax=Denitratisoma oestradiolicum TaxID=311182 RepID=A0A6S6XSK7_9PROT|nr:conserved exported protein of unknown function [Denitratisoma oestradiolicum]